jgi:two-component system, OmpR family, sensor histidine kinase KdpD
MSQRPGDRIARRPRPEPGAPPARPRPRRAIALPAPDAESSPGSRLARYSITVLVLVVVTALLAPVREIVDLLNIGLIYLLIVIAATLLAGRRTGILAAVLGFALFDFFLVPPYLTFAIDNLRNILALFVFLGISTLLSWLIAGAREQARQALRRAEDVSRLYELNQAIIGAQRRDEVLPAIAGKVAGVFEAQACWIFLPGPDRRLEVAAQAPAGARIPTRDELTLAGWAFRHGSEVAQGDPAQPDEPAGRNRATFLPLQGGRRTIGVLGVADKRDHRPFTLAERTALATFAGQAAAALERIDLLREAQRAELLARTDELKSALMSAVSHDLRTPLASIMASATSLLEPDIDWDEATRRDLLESINEEAVRLNRLVGNLLDMSRIEGGALRPEKDWYAVGEVIDAVVGRLEPRLGGHPLTVDVAPDIPLVPLDFTEIDQVISNLLENALKYTPPGTAIRIQARRAGDQVEIVVADQGPGVPAEHLAHLFDKFYRTGSVRPAHGMGLGLAISKGLVEAHGGHIRAASTPGAGLIVTFTLPIPAHAPGAAALAPAQP